VKTLVLFVFGLLLIIFLAGVAKGGKAEGATQVLNFIKALLLLIGLLIVAVMTNNFN
jgi:hypothetical protein